MGKSWYRVEYPEGFKHGKVDGQALVLVGIRYEKRGWSLRRRSKLVPIKEWIYELDFSGTRLLVYKWQKNGPIAIPMGFSLRQNRSPHAIPMEFYYKAFRSTVDHFRAETWWKNLEAVKTLERLGLNRYSEWRELHNYVKLTTHGNPDTGEKGSILHNKYYQLPARREKKERKNYYKRRFANPTFYEYENKRGK